MDSMIVDAVSNKDRNIIGNVIDYCNFLDVYTNFDRLPNIRLAKNYIMRLNNYINLLKIA